MFEELPVVLHNSHLINSLLCEMDGANIPTPRLDLFNLSMKLVVLLYIHNGRSFIIIVVLYYV